MSWKKNTGFHVVAQNHPDVGLVLENLIDLHIHIHSFTIFEPHALGDPGVQCIVVVVSQTGCITKPPFLFLGVPKIPDHLGTLPAVDFDDPLFNVDENLHSFSPGICNLIISSNNTHNFTHKNNRSIKILSVNTFVHTFTLRLPVIVINL